MRRNAILRGFLAATLLTLGAGPIGAEPLELNDEATLASLLAVVKGKNVEIQLVSGEKLTGNVKFVGQHTLQLARLRSREFYDAYIRLDQIGAFVISNQ